MTYTLLHGNGVCYISRTFAETSRLQRFWTDFGAIRNVNYTINILIGFDHEETADTSRSREVRARTWFLKYFRCRTRENENITFQRVIFKKFCGADFSQH